MWRIEVATGVLRLGDSSAAGVGFGGVSGVGICTADGDRVSTVGDAMGVTTVSFRTGWSAAGPTIVMSESIGRVGGTAGRSSEISIVVSTTGSGARGGSSAMTAPRAARDGIEPVAPLQAQP